MLFIQQIVCGQLSTKNKYWAGVVFFLSFLFKPASCRRLPVGSPDLLRLVFGRILRKRYTSVA